MSIEWPTIIEGGIPILGGLYATGLGYGIIRASRSLPSPQLQKILNLFRWLGPFVVLFGIFTAWQTHAHLAHPPAEELAQQISARLKFPVKVDDLTQAVGVEGKGENIVYSYAVTASLGELGGQEQVQRSLEQHLLGSACKNKDFQKILRAGYTVQARYSFRESAEDILISVPPRSCGY